MHDFFKEESSFGHWITLTCCPQSNSVISHPSYFVSPPPLVYVACCQYYMIFCWWYHLWVTCIISHFWIPYCKNIDVDDHGHYVVEQISFLLWRYHPLSEKYTSMNAFRIVVGPVGGVMLIEFGRWYTWGTNPLEKSVRGTAGWPHEKKIDSLCLIFLKGSSFSHLITLTYSTPPYPFKFVGRPLVYVACCWYYLIFRWYHNFPLLDSFLQNH